MHVHCELSFAKRSAFRHWNSRVSYLLVSSIQQTHRLFEWINNLYCTCNKFIDLIAFYSFFCLPFFSLVYFVCFFLCNDAQNSPYPLFYWNTIDTQHFLIYKMNKHWSYFEYTKSTEQKLVFCVGSKPLSVKLHFVMCVIVGALTWCSNGIMKNQAFDGRENQFIIISFVRSSKGLQSICTENSLGEFGWYGSLKFNLFVK